MNKESAGNSNWIKLWKEKKSDKTDDMLSLL